MAGALTTELISEIRDIVDEDNTSDLSDSKIMSALNRAQRTVARLSHQYYPELLRHTFYPVTLTSGQASISSLTNGYMVVGVEYSLSSDQFYPLKYVAPSQWSGIPAAGGGYPKFFTQEKDKIKTVPASSGTLRVIGELRLPPLVKEQGRITSYDSNLGTINVDSLGSSITTSVSNLSAFFNIIDQFTGNIKATLQANIASTSQNKITIKTTGLGRTSLYGRDVSSSLPSDIAQDDYICAATGTCIPFMMSDYSDFLVQFAVNGIKNTYNSKVDYDSYDLKDLEDALKKAWVQRPSAGRIKQNNKAWLTIPSYRRWR